MQDKRSILPMPVHLGAFSNIFYDDPTVKNSNHGFSLIESLIAIFILGIIMAGSMAFYGYANTLYYHGLHAQMATLLADSQMETCKSLGDSHIPTSNSECPQETKYSLGAVIQGLNAYESISINTTNSTYDDVAVTVSWTEPKESASRNVSLETYM